jgi:hypothetical protein
MTTHIDPEYQASAIEPTVQQDWEARKAFKVADSVEGPDTDATSWRRSVINTKKNSESWERGCIIKHLNVYDTPS